MSTTDADKSDIRERLLEVFEAVRELPGSDFEPERFIHYLVANPKGTLNVHNSFKGKRYFVKFIQQLRLHLQCASRTMISKPSIFGLARLSLPVLLILLLVRSHHQDRLRYQTLRDQITKASISAES
jgi:hypothetical protein